MGTWGGAERVVQPTDPVSGRFLCSLEHEDRKEDERASGTEPQGLVNAMKEARYQFIRLVMTLSALAALALAGGASLKGW